mgnify:CR=1 FL=1
MFMTDAFDSNSKINVKELISRKEGVNIHQFWNINNNFTCDNERGRAGSLLPKYRALSDAIAEPRLTAVFYSCRWLYNKFLEELSVARGTVTPKEYKKCRLGSLC